ncbi:heme/hemin ABC transporter substrate-binding protein [Mesobacterium pallidum]|uniref:heme/hemin ABC transporter substrate-binding protein n=1 Tax=Mesobacterium pallidum TaxID=2872037 RepID=UPI001EE3709B|nr:ABC transporter substrate-binding protein [Mesobacterium pallidum]
MSRLVDGRAYLIGTWGAIALSVAVGLAGATRAEAPAQRPADVLSIGGSVTEIVAALGQADRLQARDSTSTYPPEVTALPDLGYMRALSPEGVLAFAPSLILSDEGAGPPETLDVIRAAGVDFVEVPNEASLQGILDKIGAVGTALGVPDRAAALAEQVAAEMAAATDGADRPEAERKRVLFILSARGGRITAAGRDTAADAIIRLAGGVNAVSDIDGYKPLTDEAIGRAAPDVILMMDRGDHALPEAELFALPALRLTPAAETQAALRMDGLLLLGFGPRTPQAVRALNAALYGNGA